MLRSFLPRIFVFVAVIAGLVTAAGAQDLDNVTIAGKIADANGLSVVGATVTATQTETGDTRTTTTNDDGRYKLVNLKPGTYKIKATAAGFGVQETTEIKTISAQNVDQDFKLSPADIKAETVVKRHGQRRPSHRYNTHHSGRYIDGTRDRRDPK